MKSMTGEVTFEHTTKDDKLVSGEALVYFNKYGEQELEIISLSDAEGNEIEWHALPLTERTKIESYVYNNCIPQDEVYDDYESWELFND